MHYAGGNLQKLYLCVFFMSIIFTQVEQDSLALVALYNDTGGDSWTDNSGWLTDSPLCDWYGVNCNEEDRVSFLVLYYNNLIGTIPSELGNLENLTGLNFPHNQLTGPIPPEIGNLEHLIVLDLRYNLLTGGIPAELGNLEDLEFLNLSHNQLTGNIPPELGNLEYLESIDFEDNQLTGSIPSELGSLEYINWLSLASNQLTGSIPAELGNLGYLRMLSLNSNQLTGSIPSELGNLQNLENLDLGSNQLTGVIPYGRDIVLDLEYLNLEHNQLTGEIPPALCDLENLEYLYLGNNQLTGAIPDRLDNLSNLEELNISSNLLTGSIPAELGNLENLLQLWLQSNQLSGSIPPELGALEHLEGLYLYGNQLTGSIPAELGNLESLRELKLFSNQLSGTIPPELGNLGNLVRLWLQSNQLIGAVPESLCQLNINWSYDSFFDISSNQFCPPYPPCMTNYMGCQNTSICGQLMIPDNLQTQGDVGQIVLTWEAGHSPGEFEVILSITEVTADHIAIHMVNTVPLAGFQIDILLEDNLSAEFTNPFGGSAEAAGWIVSGNGSGTILGFSMIANAIPPGEGILTNIGWEVTGSDGYLDLNITNAADEEGNGLSYTSGPSSCYGSCADQEINYNVYRDSLLISSDIQGTTFTDVGLSQDVTCCYTVKSSDGTMESQHSEEACGITHPQYTEHFVVDLEGAGVSSLVVVEEAIGLEPGDEIGLFDAAGLISQGDCSSQYGEVLVGAGLWLNEPLTIIGSGSVDNCAAGGVQMAGYIIGHPILIKVWKADEEQEYLVDAIFTGGSSNWGDASISVEIEVNMGQIISIAPFMFNLFSFNVIPDDFSTSSVLGDDFLIVGNDAGEYYVPGYNVDMIGNLNELEGYRGFSLASSAIDLMVSGAPVDLATTITLDPFVENLIPFFPQEPMETAMAFAGYENDILMIASDMGLYWIPSLGVESLALLEPGNGYACTITGVSPLDYSYPEPALVRWDAVAGAAHFQTESQARHYQPIVTGESQAVILTELGLGILPGDEVAAYASGELVGVARVVNNYQPLVIAAWEEINEFGIALPGYSDGEEIELRVWSSREQREYRTTADLDYPRYGDYPIVTGSVTIQDIEALPKYFTLHIPYPNPFNPIITVPFQVSEVSQVEIAVYNLAGRQVALLVDNEYASGQYHVQWNGTRHASGTYFVKMKTEEYSEVRKVVLMK